MLLAQIIQNQLIEDFTNCIVWYIYLNLNMLFRIKIVEVWSSDKCLAKFDKR